MDIDGNAKCDANGIEATSVGERGHSSTYKAFSERRSAGSNSPPEKWCHRAAKRQWLCSFSASTLKMRHTGRQLTAYLRASIVEIQAISKSILFN
jgi:hypothetical protein